ncbi:FHA domain-containing protein [Mycolicibacterium mucogenicum]|uniref:FHA domain-containing protein n=1 Tax=Mycolicibacterium mucogenicum TaxID=56689 RepID=A0A4R5WLE9_MYCMU|nr:FHA domain-containing protein [Mycolicibacterium mucogenicum]TDK91857.1 FHA domain-containing protein [Mycolicibacterium mucogenicum]
MSLIDEPRLGDDVAVHRKASEVRPGSGVLVINRGPGPGGQFLLADEVVAAGRHPDSAVFLDDITVSRHHAEIRWLDDEYWIIDAGSLNGTYVNGTPVQALPLTSGDEIQIGKFRLGFTCRPQDR